MEEMPDTTLIKTPDADSMRQMMPADTLRRTPREAVDTLRAPIGVRPAQDTTDA
jgi:hypothetical protein